MKRIKCPHCGRGITPINQPKLFHNAMLHCENYGGSSYTFKCGQCRKKFTVYLDRKVVCCGVAKAKDAADLSY